MPISARKSLRDVSDDKTYCVLGVVNLSPFSKFTLLPLAMRGEGLNAPMKRDSLA
jgi:hypothetical protein